MDDLIVWPSKKVIDLTTIEYDLFDQLPAGVTIVSVVVSSIVFQGYADIAAASMLWLVPVIHNSLIQQKVRNGIPGNVYNIQFDIHLSDGQEWIKTFRLAIVPNNTPAVPVSIPLYFTSQPYPIEFVDWLGSSISMLAGSFLLAPNPADNISSAIVMQSGQLRTITQFYNYVYEDIQPQIQMQSGTLVAIVKSYAYKFEDITTSIVMRSGTITVVVVNYPYPHENINSSINMQSGTLV